MKKLNEENLIDDFSDAGVEEEFRFDLAKARMNVLPHGVRKVRVNIWLDDDIVAEFKTRAAQSNAAPFQTQINQTLREALGENVPVPDIDNPQFIQQLSEKIGEYLIAHAPKAKPNRKAA